MDANSSVCYKVIMYYKVIHNDFQSFLGMEPFLHRYLQHINEKIIKNLEYEKFFSPHFINSFWT